MENLDITPEEIETYSRKLIPKLARYPPWHWVRIADIAHNVERFIGICQYLADRGAFDDEDGEMQIDIYKDTFVRLNPLYWDKKRLHKHNPYDRKTQHQKQNPF